MFLRDVLCTAGYLVASLGEDVHEAHAGFGVGFDVPRGVGRGDIGDDDGIVVVGLEDFFG